MNRITKRLSHFLFQFLLVGLALMSSLTWSSSAHAAGRVVWKSTTIQEKGGDGEGQKGWWRLDLEIHLPKAPNVAWYSMRIEFEPVAYYERALVDGKEGPQEMVQVLHGQQSMIETQDVGFQDPGTGQIQARTKFTFKVTRGHGYEAGEYKVTIRDGQTGNAIGVPTTLKFKGENKIVDRRSMVFQSSDSKKKKKEKAAEAAPEEGAAEPEGASADAPSAEPETAGSAPPPVEERPGGGCHVGAAPHLHAPTWAFLLAALVGLGLLARRSGSLASRPVGPSGASKARRPSL
jgi:MYXO-CTERM domain-containing protein